MGQATRVGSLCKRVLCFQARTYEQNHPKTGDICFASFNMALLLSFYLFHHSNVSPSPKKASPPTHAQNGRCYRVYSLRHSRCGNQIKTSNSCLGPATQSTPRCSPLFVRPHWKHVSAWAPQLNLPFFVDLIFSACMAPKSRR